MPQAKRQSTRRRRKYKPYPMSDAQEGSLEEFISTGRIGRRNALPDILDKNHAGVGTAGLSDTLEKLKCSAMGNRGNSDDEEESSKSDSACAKGGDDSKSEKDSKSEDSKSKDGAS